MYGMDESPMDGPEADHEDAFSEVSTLRRISLYSDITLTRASSVATRPDQHRYLGHTAMSNSIRRKPVAGRSASGGSSVAQIGPRNIPNRSQSAGAALALQHSEHRSPPAHTDALLDQASASLSSLTGDVTVSSPAEELPSYEELSMDPPVLPNEKRTNRVSETPIPSRYSDLLEAIRGNQVNLLRRMVNQTSVADEIEPSTLRTAVIEAAMLQRLDAATILIKAGFRVYSKDIDGWAALHYAAARGNVEICRLLLDAGAVLEEQTKDGQTALSLAVEGGHLEAIHLLLNIGQHGTSSANFFTRGFLHATKSGNVRAAELFVERGVQPRKIKEQWRPVIFAAQSGSVAMIDFLLAQRCNIKQRDPDGASALHFAAQLGHLAMVERLLALELDWRWQIKKNKQTALHLASYGRHTSTAMALVLDKNAKLNMADTDGMMAIHHAARNGDATLTTALLNKGAITDEPDRFGWTPMLLVCAYGHLPLVVEFVTRGVDLEEKLSSTSFSRREKTNEAARKGYWAEIRWPHPQARPLHLALEFGQDDVANTLIAAGAKIEASDSEGWRALHYAAFNGRYRMVELLLSRGASPQATTASGNTAYSLGFRDAGVTASYEDKMQIHDLLHAAMNVHKKSKFKQLSGAMRTSAEKSYEIIRRNKAWYTAHLAETLYVAAELEGPSTPAEVPVSESRSQSLDVADEGDRHSGNEEPRPNENDTRLSKAYTN